MVRFRHATVSAVLVSVLAGCSGLSGESEESEAAPEASPTWAELMDGPLEELLGYARPTTAEEYIAQDQAVQDAIAACMAEQGFDYWPKVPEPDDVVFRTGQNENTIEFAERYGYGVFTPYLNGAGIEAIMPTIPEEEEYLAGLSETEMLAYNEALYGIGPLTNGEGDPDDPDFMGCLPQAHNLVGAGDEAAQAARDEAASFLATLPSRGEFTELNEEWADCMRNAGYGYASPRDAVDHFVELYEEHTAGYDWDAEPDLSEDGDHPEGGEELSEDNLISDPALAGSQDLAEEEKATAVADRTCQIDLDYQSRYEAIDHQLQQDYIDSHQGELDALISVDG